MFTQCTEYREEEIDFVREFFGKGRRRKEGKERGERGGLHLYSPRALTAGAIQAHKQGTRPPFLKPDGPLQEESKTPPLTTQ